MKNMSHYTYIYIRIDFHFVFKIILWNTIVKWIKVVLKFQNYILFRRGFPPENYQKYIYIKIADPRWRVVWHYPVTRFHTYH